jgi:hypothetical protein
VGDWVATDVQYFQVLKVIGGNKLLALSWLQIGILETKLNNVSLLDRQDRPQADPCVLNDHSSQPGIAIS